MLREVFLEVKGGTGIAETAERMNCSIELIKCKDIAPGKKGLLVEVSGENSNEFIRMIRRRKQVLRVFHEKISRDRVIALLIVSTPSYCTIVDSSGAFCTTCPVVSSNPWRLIVKDEETLRKTLSTMEASDIRAEINGLSSPFYEQRLTSRQKEILVHALKSGYFEYPRKKSLTQLAKELSIKPSTLSEIMRRAEIKAIKHYVNTFLLAEVSKKL